MDHSATAREQRDMAERLIELGQRLARRADGAGGDIEEHVVMDQNLTCSAVKRLQR